MSSTATIVNSYIAMWNEGDPDRRRELAAETLTEDATYLDPIMSGEGVDGIGAMIAGAQQQYPGHRFTLSLPPDAHHDRVRFGWSLESADGTFVASGVDFATVSADGRLRAICGFIEPA